ncbi:MAG: alpha/beta hydrolase [Hymenobacter sp.]
MVGHDWGAAVTWHLAAHHPARIRRAAVLNVPHPRALAGALRRQAAAAAEELVRILLPTAVAARNPGARCAGRGWRARPCGAPAAPARSAMPISVEYQAAWARPGALRSMINWYRAAARLWPAAGPGWAAWRCRCTSSGAGTMRF